MLRGFIGGALAGGVLGLGLSTVASVLAPPPEAPQVSDDVAAVAQTPQDNASLDTGAQTTAEPENTTTGLTSSLASAPEPDTLDDVVAPATAPAIVPQTGVASSLESPEGEVATAALPAVQDEPVLQNPQALAPMVPQPADDLTIATAPASPPEPAVVEEPEVQVEIVEPESEAEPEVVEAEVTPERQSAEEQMPQLEEEQATPTEEVAEQTSEPENTAPETGQAEAPVETVDAVEPEAEPAETQPTPTEEVTAGAEAPSDQTEETASESESETPDIIAEAEPEAAPVEEEDEPQVAMIAPSSRPQIGKPAVSLTDRETGVAVRRPTTQADEPEAAPETESAEETAEANAASTDPRPIGQFSQPFENPEDKPLMSIVLIDTGDNPTSGAPGIAALRTFPYTLSFAVDSSLPDAAERMALYRDEGFEVLAMVDLPEGAQPTDAETTLNVTLSQLPEVVAVLEGTQTGLQPSRPVSDQVSAILAETGHGLVTQNRGLNTMPKLARKEGVPATPIFRDFDSKGQTATVIRRFLDQAAFKAGQEGAVIMLGRLRPDTITALLLWGLQDRAGQVALAPISAVLLREDG